MKNRNYRRGREAEYRTARRLEAEGYDCTRAAGSHGVWDVCAVRGDHVRFIQVKLGKPISPVELATFAEWKCPASCTREVWWWQPRKRDPIVTLI